MWGGHRDEHLRINVLTGSCAVRAYCMGLRINEGVSRFRRLRHAGWGVTSVKSFQKRSRDKTPIPPYVLKMQAIAGPRVRAGGKTGFCRCSSRGDRADTVSKRSSCGPMVFVSRKGTAANKRRREVVSC